MDSAAVDPLATSRPSSGVVVAATATTLRKLASPAPEIRFDAIPFSDAVDFLRDVTDLNIFVNWRALESAGVDRNAPVTVRLKNVPYEQALHYMLRDVGGGSVKLDFAVVDGIVNIATEEALAEEVLVRVYNITRLLDAMPTTMPAPAGEMMLDPEQARREKVQAVVRLITETIAPDSWRSAGGAIGNIDEINGRLVVAQTEKNHAAIAKLLEEVSAGDGDSAAAAQK